jgi:hypothetical protein
VISYDDGWTCIFKCIHGIWYSSYCFITNDGDFHTGYEEHAIDSEINGNAHPATKEQCNLLFQKIKEAGYKWNQETKTLEKLIEPKFRDGDIVSAIIPSVGGTWIGIFKQYENGGTFETYCGLSAFGEFHTNSKRHLVIGTHLATEEEKEKLFQAIESNGYKWNPETKTLEEVTKPKFEVGDRIKHKVTSHYYTIEEVKNDCYYVKSNKDDECFSLVLFLFEKDYELVPNKFDIYSLIPYESKVLVRNSPAGYWMPTFWGAYVSKNPGKHQNRMYLTTKGFTNYCIPFEGNEALMGTADDCDNFYKTWEE